MDYEQYKNAFFIDPAPDPRFHFSSAFGTTLYYQDYSAAVEYFTQVLGPPAYVEGAGTRGWPIGNGWLTLLKGQSGNPKNLEITFVVDSPAEAERLQSAFIAAGGQGPLPSDQLMFVPVRSCPVKTPQGTDLLIISRLPG